jgi:hypothetical protein
LGAVKKEPTTATAADIEFALMRRHGKTTIMPRFTPAHWWECDVCEITANGYMREFEIKTSRSDFLRDAKKHTFAGWNSPNPRQRLNKHELLASGDTRGPSCFYFATPKGLLDPHDIPVWAGLIEVTMDSRRSSYPIEEITVKAPKLHRQKADPKIRLRMLQNCYSRLHAQWFNTYYLALCRKDGVSSLEIDSP